ncbi:MAG: valine--tRNA ligase, partial [Patescibacteria group bacterium]|nr:valine--tRNA ligase [Patescibacteria group bacterium]
MQKNYTASHHESDVYQSWKESGLFNPDVCAEQGYCTSGENFSIVLPPPNVTGQLHLGHAAMAAFQDIMVRYHRMKGDKTLWLPGTDHAAIATQSVVEKSLVDQGMPDRKEMGREKFLDHCWDWTHKYRDRINGQISAMGSSLDWSREKFTLDLEVSESVENIFHDMYRDGLIYRGARMVNWCPKCESTLSDDEVDHKDVNGKMYHMLYEIQDFVPANTDQKQNLIELNGKWHLTIATTRPETLFGDTAVAVHPEDTRFNFLVGQKAVLPFIDRVIPIIGDDYVNMEKGTGCLKVTPGHDPNDYKIGQRHKLETINVFHDNAHLNEQAGKFENVERFIARKQLIAELQAEGKIPEVKENPHSVGHCYRHGDTPIEPLVSPQWFVDVNKPIASRGNKSLKELMLDAVRSGETELVPDRFNKVYYNWIEDLEDWCISRQIWWGHRIPVWYDHAGNICVDRALAEKEGYRQDEDTLDTWFSSGLWPFSTLDGPKDTADMRDYFPNSVLETGHDIIFFWVARMILMSTYALGKSPFKTVYMHGMVC